MTWQVGEPDPHVARAVLEEHTDKDDGEWKALKGLHRGLLFSRPRANLADVPKLSTESLATSLDWRTKGVVTPVKNQGGCGVSCHRIRQPSRPDAQASAPRIG